MGVLQETWQKKADKIFLEGGTVEVCRAELNDLLDEWDLLEAVNEAAGATLKALGPGSQSPASLKLKKAVAALEHLRERRDRDRVLSQITVRTIFP